MPVKMTPAPPVSATTSPTTDTTVLLELSLYTNLTMGERTYVQGTPYRFSQAHALRLLSELDAGRQVWRIFRPVEKKVEKPVQVVDRTNIPLPEDVEPIHGVDPDPKKRIEVGTEDEIADILSRPDNPDENEQV